MLQFLASALPAFALLYIFTKLDIFPEPNKNIFITFILGISLIKFAYSEDVTMKYGGDWVNTTVIQNGDFMSMAGSFVGTNVMQMGSEEIRTNFKCTGLFQTAPAPMLMGSCNMKQAGTQDFWVLNWNCTVTGTGKEKCKGNAIGGTGRFKGIKGVCNYTVKYLPENSSGESQ